MSRKSKQKQIEITKTLGDPKDLKKLSLYVVIVARSKGKDVVRLFQRHHSSYQIVSYAEGSANKPVYEILGVESDKVVIIATVTDDIINEISEELDIFLLSSKQSSGIGFCIPLSSIIGISAYKLLTNSI